MIGSLNHDIYNLVQFSPVTSKRMWSRKITEKPCVMRLWKTIAKSRKSEQCYWHNWTSLLNIGQFIYAATRDLGWQSNHTKIVTVSTTDILSYNCATYPKGTFWTKLPTAAKIQIIFEQFQNCVVRDPSHTFNLGCLTTHDFHIQNIDLFVDLKKFWEKSIFWLKLIFDLVMIIFILIQDLMIHYTLAAQSWNH